MRGMTDRMYSPSLNWMSTRPFVRFTRTMTVSHPRFVCTLTTSPTRTSSRCTARCLCFCRSDCSALSEPAFSSSAAAVLSSSPSGTEVSTTASASLELRRRASLGRGRALTPAVSRSMTSLSSSAVRDSLASGRGASASALRGLPRRCPGRPSAWPSGRPSSSPAGCCVRRTVRRDVPPMSISQMLIAASWTCMYWRSFSSEGYRRL
mmetsp:Transcript_45408/g.144767  ORF Transcript_45408/g.144767 Transcript_45408/m.144767 type:complete len:207 (+) Transcript_45408:305-925(+)